jgi:hypothetical protein
VEAGVEGGRREGKKGGNVGGGEFFEVIEDDEFALGGVELSEGGTDGFGERVGIRKSGGGAVTEEALEEVQAEGLTAAKGAAGVDGDACEPGEEVRVGAEGFAGEVGVNEGVLDGVIRVGGVAGGEEAAGEAGEARGVEGDGGVEGGDISGGETGGEGGVVGEGEWVIERGHGHGCPAGAGL